MMFDGHRYWKYSDSESNWSSAGNSRVFQKEFWEKSDVEVGLFLDIS